MKKVLIASNKGGVGKTTVASQIVYTLADRGHSVIGVDLDSQRNFTGAFDGVKDLGNALDLVTRGTPIEADVNAGEIGILSGHKDLLVQNADDVLPNVRNGLVHSRGADFCVIDAPPSFSEVVYGALLGSDCLLVPHAIHNRAAYVQAQDAGVSLVEIKTRSGREAAAEFGAFFDWFHAKVTGETGHGAQPYRHAG